MFERDEEDEPESRFPAEYFKRLFQFFSEYNFTIDENNPNDAEVGGWDTTIRKTQYEKLFYNQQSSLSEVDYSAYSRVAEPVETTRRVAKTVDSKPTAKETPTSTVVQIQPVTMTITPSLQEEQAKQLIEAKLESIGIESNVIHKKFGQGTVVKINKNEKFIHVKFTLGEKKFIFPDAFLMGFLEIDI